MTVFHVILIVILTFLGLTAGLVGLAAFLYKFTLRLFQNDEQ